MNIAAEAAVGTRSLSVALVFMPFAIPERPSIQLGLLSSIAQREGHRVSCHHFNLDLAARMPEIYSGLCTFRGHMTGEWLFSIAAFGAEAPQDDAAYFAAFPSEVTQAARGGIDPAFLIRLRREVLPAFIEDCVAAEDWGSRDVVGFSSTFQQNCASLALARRLKARWPHLRIVFGGANLEGDMGREALNAFPWIDHVATGEGDLAFPALLKAIADEAPARPVPGIAHREGADAAADLFDRLDTSPIPDYDEYFERFGRLGLAKHQKYFPALPLETARGCWWGRKHHCTFCGLNGAGMTFRAKSAGRMLDEIEALSSRYGLTMFQSTDNILDMSYLTEVFPKIASDRNDYTFFYEVKSNITRSQLAQMRKGGVMWIQPGIESMSDDVLTLMEKGCTALHNVRLLKWSLYYRIRVGWNLRWGFPGETEANSRDEYEVLRKIPHLEPPNAVTRLWLERFSPIFFDRARFPASHFAPEASYTHVYPGHVDLTRLAYFFDYMLDGTTAPEVHRPTEALVAQWTERWHSGQRPGLWFRRAGDTIWISDTRHEGAPVTHRFSGPVAHSYLACCDTMHSAGRVAEMVRAEIGGDFSDADAGEVLAMFCDLDLMIGSDGLFLGLALPSNPNW